jgi:hypothetical protein
MRRRPLRRFDRLLHDDIGRDQEGETFDFHVLLPLTTKVVLARPRRYCVANLMANLPMMVIGGRLLLRAQTSPRYDLESIWPRIIIWIVGTRRNTVDAAHHSQTTFVNAPQNPSHLVRVTILMTGE